MAEGGQASGPLPRVARGDEPRNVPVGETGEAGDRASDRGRVADGEGGCEDPRHLRVSKVHCQRSDQGDRVVRERPVEREPGVELLEMAGELRARTIGSHRLAGPAPGIYRSRPRGGNHTPN